jgi:PhoPQ-activated pathogenicity-related protein
VLGFYQAIIARTPLPSFSWTLEKDGAIRVTASDRPGEVKLWRATNPKARDFRLESLGAVWQSTPLEPAEGGSYWGRVAAPEAGYTAFFIELTFANGGGTGAFKLTTPARVVPDALPFHFAPARAAR